MFRTVILAIPQVIPALLVLYVLLVTLEAPPAHAATPDAMATVVVFNNSIATSVDLAGYYATKRGIPFDRLIGLDCPDAETIERADYDRTIANPLRDTFTERGWWRPGLPGIPGTSSTTGTSGTSLGDTQVVENNIRYLVIIRGVPLRIAPTTNYPGDQFNGPAPVSQINSAAVDSELACLGFNTRVISGAMKNPYFRSYKTFADAGFPGMMIVGRLDAPEPAMVRRMIDESLQAEKSGLWGFAYVDSRGLCRPDQAGKDYSQSGKMEEGDAWMQRIAIDLRKQGIPVIQEDTEALIPENYPIGTGRVAQYYGWYAEHVAGVMARKERIFAPGAVACHIHSYSATTLRDPQKGWVGPLLARGAAASMGNVYEPYLALTPNLDLFEQRLREGFSFGESAYSSMRVLSWMTTVVGDPLYTPFKVIRDEPVPTEAREWESYRKGALAWWANPHSAGQRQLIQSARELRSGIIFESLGVLEADVGDPKVALAAFREGRKQFNDEEDIMRMAIHEVQLLGKSKDTTNSKGSTANAREALDLIRSLETTYPKACGMDLLRAAASELQPPASTGTASKR